MGLLWPGRRQVPEDEFVAFYAARAGYLRNTAYLLCGDWYLAEDLTQIAVTKLYQAWHRIERHDTVDRYARQVLLRTFLDERRRPWRREHPTTPESTVLDTVARDGPNVDERMVLRTALMRLPKGQRAVLVLRFWEDRSVEQVAEILSCSTGSVKSQTAHGLTKLRTALGGALDDLKPPLRGGQP